MPFTSTLGSDMTSRELCLANDWRPGYVLRAAPLDKAQLRRDFVVRLLGLGLERVLVVAWDWQQGEWERREMLLHLPTRDWRLETLAEERARRPVVPETKSLHGGAHVREGAPIPADAPPSTPTG